jgi:hypothetical protein
MIRVQTILGLLSIGFGILPTNCAAQDRPIAIRNVRTGPAALLQQGRLTILDIELRPGHTRHIALTHPSDSRQGTNAPYAAQWIAESPDHFLIFTDTFASEPGDTKGHCAAGKTGERFVHVVALSAIPHETLSVLAGSCLLDVEPAAGSPEWVAKKDSTGFVGRLRLRFEGDTQPTAAYYVAPDGEVTRPDIYPDSPKSR